MLNHTYYWLILLLFLASCKEEGSENAEGEKVFYNAKIYTVNEAQPWADAMYLVDGRIEGVGTDEEMLALAGPDAELVDLAGDFVMPGIHDVHMHPLEASSDNFQFTVNENVWNPENYVFDVEAAHLDHPGDGWLLGWGHWLDVLLEADRPPREILDEVSTDRPIAVMEQTSHSIWCNTYALQELGFWEAVDDPIGGIIMRDGAAVPNGVLIDNAGNMMIDEAVASNPNSVDNDYLGLVDYGLPELARYGITSICDARAYWKRDHHLTWKRLEDEGKLTARVNLGLWAYPTEEDASQLTTLQSLYSYDPTRLLQINQIKLYSDGITHNTTAALNQEYVIDYFEQADNNGLNYFSQDRAAQYIAALEGTGFDFHIHAIGNRGVHEALNAIEESGSAAGRHRLTHVEMVDPADYSRFAGLNVTADAQVAGDFSCPDHWHDNDYLIGADLAAPQIPIKDLHEAGARVTLSSDWDVSDLNPFTGMKNAITRSPQELTLEEVIKAYTINAAYVMRQEERVGSIEAGKEADFVVLSRDLFDSTPNQIGNVNVIGTYLRGGRVYP